MDSADVYFAIALAVAFCLSSSSAWWMGRHVDILRRDDLLVDLAMAAFISLFVGLFWPIALVAGTMVLLAKIIYGAGKSIRLRKEREAKGDDT